LTAFGIAAGTVGPGPPRPGAAVCRRSRRPSVDDDGPGRKCTARTTHHAAMRGPLIAGITQRARIVSHADGVGNRREGGHERGARHA